MRSLSEDDVQKALVTQLKWQAPDDLVYLHVHNNPRNKIDGARLKRMGLVSGAPDLLYFFRGKFFGHELKTEVGRLSDNQKLFHERFEAAGGRILVSYGLDQAIQHAREVGIIKRGSGYAAEDGSPQSS